MDTTGEIPELVERVRAHIKEQWDKLPDAKKFRCVDRPDDNHQGCHEHSTAETEFCPFCGDGGEGDKVVSITNAIVKSVVGKKAATKPAQELVLLPKGGGPAAATAVVVSAEEMTQELDAAVKKIDTLRTNLAGNSYDIGAVLLDVHGRELWKARGHDSFKAFVEKEVSLSRKTVYQLMEVCKQFDRPTAIKLGAKKLSLIATIDDETDRAGALTAAEGGASTREIRDLAKKTTPREPKADDDAAPEREKPGTIVLLAKVNGKAQTFPWRSATSGRPLKEHADDSYVEVQISDDVVVRFSLKTNKAGDILGAVVKFEKS